MYLLADVRSLSSPCHLSWADLDPATCLAGWFVLESTANTAEKPVPLKPAIIEFSRKYLSVHQQLFTRASIVAVGGALGTTPPDPHSSG
jgi:hypothetical protein